jgi:hypothetical protein
VWIIGTGRCRHRDQRSEPDFSPDPPILAAEGEGSADPGSITRRAPRGQSRSDAGWRSR